MSNFNLTESIDILKSTPDAVHRLTHHLSEEWLAMNEGGDTWSTFDIVGHLIHGEKTDWIPRINIILNDGDKSFTPFDRFAQFEASQGKSFSSLLEEFTQLRKNNISILLKMNLGVNDFSKKGVHPEFGTVTLSELISAWVVHDMSHLHQICRVLAKYYKNDVGPWFSYMPILSR